MYGVRNIIVSLGPYTWSKLKTAAYYGLLRVIHCAKLLREPSYGWRRQRYEYIVDILFRLQLHFPKTPALKLTSQPMHMTAYKITQIENFLNSVYSKWQPHHGVTTECFRRHGLRLTPVISDTAYRIIRLFFFIYLWSWSGTESTITEANCRPIELGLDDSWQLLWSN
jgi:hypothetical protein